MNDTYSCPRCGAEITSDAPQGLCPKCLMAEVMASEEPRPSEMSTLSAADRESTRSDRVKVGPLNADTIAATDETPGRYSVLGEYGKGGMGRVLLVHDEHLGRDIALKELLPERGDGSTPTAARHSKEMAARFLREAKITGQLEHPSITPVHEIGRKADGTLYYTMKLVRGRTLSKAIKSAKNFEERLKLLPHFVDLCNAIAYAHSRGVIHRDIKPSNIMIGDYGETVIIDWGLAKVKGKSAPESTDDPAQKTFVGMRTASAQDDSARTQYGQAMGTPAYMPPEQATGDLDHVDERSDIYSLGAVLFEILTGQPPVEGKSVAEILRNVIGGKIRKVRAVEPKCQKVLAAIAEKALALEPERRYQSAMSFGATVQKWKPVRVSRLRRVAGRVVLATMAAAVMVTLGLDVYYCRLVNDMHDQIRREGSYLELADFRSPRESEAQPAEESAGESSVWSFLVSMSSDYPKISAETYLDLFDIWSTTEPHNLTADQERTIEFYSFKHKNLLEYTMNAAARPPSTSQEIVEAMRGIPVRDNVFWKSLGDRYQSWRHTPKLLSAGVAVHLKEGCIDQALEYFIGSRRLGAHLLDSPASMDKLFGYSILADVEYLKYFLNELGETPTKLHELTAILEINLEQQKCKPLIEGLRYQAYQAYRDFDRNSEAGFGLLKHQEPGMEYSEFSLSENIMYRLLGTSPLRWLRRRDELHLFTHYAKLIAACDGPSFQLNHVLDPKLLSMESMGPIGSLLVNTEYSWGDGYLRHFAVAYTKLSIAAISLAATTYKIDHGVFPSSLAALTPDYLATIPTDIYDGQSLRYRREGDGYIVYSLGADREDNGGHFVLDNYQGQGDIGWRVE